MRDGSRASHELRRSESKKAKLDRAEQQYKQEARCTEPVNERAGMLRVYDLLERSES